MDTNQQKTAKNHKIELDNHKLLSVSGVKSVPVFTGTTLNAELDGETLIVSGHDLNVKNLDVENGRLTVTGFVTAIKYSSEVTPKSFLKRVFK